jgi:hypothetical protein
LTKKERATFRKGGFWDVLAADMFVSFAVGALVFLASIVQVLNLERLLASAGSKALLVAVAFLSSYLIRVRSDRLKVRKEDE